MPSVAAELALELARANRSHGTKRAKTQEVQAFQLLHVERELARRKRSEERACRDDLHEAAWSRAGRGKPGGERAGRKTEPRFAADRGFQQSSSFADRFARLRDAADIQPRDAFDSNFD
jgi:hypothetical protein